MARYIIVSIAGGVLFGLLDGLINANPLAQRLYAFLRPVARKSVNALAGIIVDLAYGFVMAGVFLVLYPSLPGSTGLAKGLSYALFTWFFRVLMYAVSQWMMLVMPSRALLYMLASGFVEMLLLGILYGAALRPL